jgi:type IV pilus assembly protein PilE
MKKVKGFTLIELMIVAAIIGILGAISMSFYGDYVLRANRTDARTALSEIATSLEKCRSLYSVYNHANCNVKIPDSGLTSDSGYYSITAAFTPQTAATAFTLTATPVAGQPQANDADCKTLTLDNTGFQDATGSNAAECW